MYAPHTKVQQYLYCTTSHGIWWSTITSNHVDTDSEKYRWKNSSDTVVKLSEIFIRIFGSLDSYRVAPAFDKLLNLKYY